jgi:hypothetical protein
MSEPTAWETVTLSKEEAARINARLPLHQHFKEGATRALRKKPDGTLWLIVSGMPVVVREPKAGT